MQRLAYVARNESESKPCVDMMDYLLAMTSDPVSEELRAVERQVDAHYKENLLTRRPFAEACGYFCEELMFLPLLKEGADTVSHYGARADNVIQHAKTPIKWLRAACPAGGTIRRKYDEQTYEAAWKLSELGLAYLSFEGAFSNATAGLLKLTLDGQRIRVSGQLRDDYRFEAYDRLLSPRMKELDVEAVDESFLMQLDASVQVRRASFTYGLNPKIVQAGLEALSPAIVPRFSLPDDWKFPAFSLAEFRQVASVLWTLAFMHFRARFIAASQGCEGVGVSNALIVMSRDEIGQRVRRYSHLSEAVVSAVLRVLTYGECGQLNPDPALQPIIPASPSTVGLSPSIVLNSSMERNLSVLLNRMPEERQAYTVRSQDRESSMRAGLIDSLGLPGIRFWFGNVPEWGTASQIDLVVISDIDKHCLILELKSFIAPAEPREIRERSEEIAKGVSQIQRRMEANKINPDTLHAVLSTTPGYRLSWAVVSENSIGTPDVQHSGIPVVNAEHFCAKFRCNPSLAACTRWLDAGEYLPKEGVDYKVHLLDDTVGAWTLEWWALELLTEDFIMKE